MVCLWLPPPPPPAAVIVVSALLFTVCCAARLLDTISTLMFELYAFQKKKTKAGFLISHSF